MTEKYSPKKTRTTSLIWFLIIASIIVWLCYRVGAVQLADLYLADWYNLLIVLPVFGVVALSWLKDPLLMKLRERFQSCFIQRESVSKGECSVNKQPGKKQLNKRSVFFGLLIALVLLNGFFISYDNLDVLPLQNDEFLSNIAVQYILDGHITFNDLQYGADSNVSEDFYSRALPYSLGAALTVKLLGGDYNDYFNLRFFSVICGTLTILVIYFWLRRHLTRLTLLFTVFSFSVLYIFVYYSRVARMYAFHMLLFFLMVMLFDRLFSRIQRDERTRYVNIRDTVRYFVLYIRKNLLLILLFLAVFAVDLKVHYTSIFILPIIFGYMLMHVRSHRQLFYPVILVVIMIMAFIVLFFSGFHFIGDWYFNSRQLVHWKFLDYNFAYLRGGFLTLPLFLFPLFFFTRLPSAIKMSYAAFFTILPMYIYLFNGNMFGDPRYMMFLYPFYLITVVYAIYLITTALFNRDNKHYWFAVPAFAALFIILVAPLNVSGLCQDNVLFACPISHQSRIFTLDRWNYNHDEYFRIIKENTTSDTVIASRTIYDFYVNKYQLGTEIFKLSNLTKGYVDKGRKYTISELEEKEVILVVYPHLSYYANLTEPYNDVYNYLLRERQDKIELYRSAEDKVIIYKYGKIR